MKQPPRSNASVTAFEAKNRLGHILDRVEAGERLIITRHGEPVAELSPVSGSRDPFRQALATFARIRAELASTGVRVSRSDLKAWREEGRR